MDNIYSVVIAGIVAITAIVAIVYGYEIKKLKNFINDSKENSSNEV